MDKEKTIMLCLENMGIGGVETYVINQAIALKKKGYNVLVVANTGIYVQKLKEIGVDFFDFEFTNKNYFDFDRIKILVDLIKNNNVGQVHINQFSLMTDLLPACFLTNTPYVTYLHMSFSMIINDELNTYNWFEKSYPIYKELFNLLFCCSSKIIAITQAIADYTSKRYNIDKDKIIVIPNSIFFEEYEGNFKKISQIKNVLIIGRLREEKLNSIFAGIDLFKELNQVFGQTLHLNIAGDGPDKNRVEEYIRNSKICDNSISLLGAVTNIPQVIEKNDIVIGVDRCILEAIAAKRIAIVSGYDKKIKGIVESQKLLDAKCDNFSGNNLSEVNLNDLINKIYSLDEKQINEIVEDNYNFAKEYLNINKNVYIERYKQFTYDIMINEIIKSMILINNELGKISEYTADKIEKNWKEHEEYKNWADSKIGELENNYQTLKKIEEEKESTKFYRFIKKIKKILKR